ncbi:hypothetical protein HYT55_04235 [Candidatus Woesearchaeota archaeon]|nr:hypothetical protein [Candidatus Woesearchaeota archaeon]
MTSTTLLHVRRTAKRRKPAFVVKESHFLGRVKKRWRLPRGLHSAPRQRYRGRPAQPHPGYGSPKAVRGLSREGLVPVVIHAVKDILTLKPGMHGAIIGRDVGSRKKLSLLALAQEKKITILQVKDVTALTNKIKDAVTQRQKDRRNRKQVKSKKQAEHRKKSEEKSKKKAKGDSAATESTTEKGIDGVVDGVPITEKEEERKIAEKTITKRQ